MLSRLTRSPHLALGAIVALAFLARVWVSQFSTEANLDADGAHLLNVARCFAEGQGFSNPAAWPAWMKPASLPMPETFKEPAYSWLISRLAPLTGEWFRTGQWISTLAGALGPWATYALARRRGLETGVALLAALLVAASPLALEISVRIMVESTFLLAITLLFLAASAPPPGVEDRRSVLRDAVAGGLFGLTFLLRAQALLLVLPLLALFLERRTVGKALGRLAVAAVAAVVVMSPLLLRNLRLFGTPLHSDVMNFALWPYVDHITFSHGLEHPPAILPFVLAHVPQVIRHMAESAVRFLNDALPGHILGSALWLLPLAAGALLALRDLRAWGFALLYLGGTMVFIFALHWDARYFSSGMPLWCMLAASGALFLVRAAGDARLFGPIGAQSLFAATLVVLVASQAWTARRVLRAPALPEVGSARAEAAFLRERLAPNESVMVVTTSTWSWFTQRPSVHLVIADDARMRETFDRLRVRYAALPTARLPEFAARYPGGRLPSAFEFDHVDSAHGVTLFAIRPETAR
jgi:hypothetical protein